MLARVRSTSLTMEITVILLVRHYAGRYGPGMRVTLITLLLVMISRARTRRTRWFRLSNSRSASSATVRWLLLLAETYFGRPTLVHPGTEPAVASPATFALSSLRMTSNIANDVRYHGRESPPVY